MLEAITKNGLEKDVGILAWWRDDFSSDSAEHRADSLGRLLLCVMYVFIWEVFFWHEEEVVSDSCQNRSVSLQSGNSSCHKVRSSRPCGNLPTLLTLWHEELPDYRGKRYYLDMFCWTNREGMDKNEVRRRTREKREWRRRDGQYATSEQSKKATSEKLDFFRKTHVFIFL